MGTDGLPNQDRLSRTEELLASFRAMVEGAGEEIYLARPDGRIVYVNGAAARSLGWSREELLAKVVAELDEGGADAYRAHVETLVPGEARTFETVHVTRDGRRVPKEVKAVGLTINGEEYICGFARDISERKASDARIRTITRLYSLLSQVNQAIVRTRDRDRLFATVCQVAVECGGFRMAWIGTMESSDERVVPVAQAGYDGGYLAAWYGPGVMPKVWSPVTEALAEGRLVVCEDIAGDERAAPWREKALARGYAASAAVPMRLKGVTVGVLALYASERGLFNEDERELLAEIGLDLSFALEAMIAEEERQLAELALRENEERLEQALRVADTGVFDHDHLSGVIYWSPHLRRIFGVADEHVATVDGYVALTHPDERARVLGEIVRAHDPSADGLWDVEHRLVRPDGTIRWITARAQTYFDGEGAARRPVRTVGAIRDITEHRRAEVERQKLEIQLTQAQKMESVGRLAGGIAHDFNNLLTVILGHADLAVDDAGPENPVRGDLIEIQRAARRSADLTRQLLAFARQQTVTPRLLNLNDSVAGSLKMLRPLLGEDIALDWAPSPNLWLVKIDPAQIDQILANLTVNARDAIAENGSIRITTGNAVVDDWFAADHEWAMAGDYVTLSVTDNGCGMDRATMAHLFEPFFTTKAEGHGTGLGMATVYGIVKQNEGLIHVDSAPGAGTTVTVYLPRREETEEQLETNIFGTPIAPGEGLVLLVEDEPMVLQLTRTMLERLGYTVLVASTPGEAIRLCRQHGSAIHLVLTDVVMPEMNGRQLFRQLIEIHPSLRGIFMSGHAATVLAGRGLLHRDDVFVQKPFTLHELATTVERVRRL